MKHTKMLAFAAFSLAALLGSVYAATPSYISNYSAFQSWLPVLFIAVMLGIMIAAAYYFVGSILNNSKIKSRAMGELGQAIGTGVVIAIIIVIFALIGSGQLSLVPLLSPTSVNTICAQLSSSQVSMLNSHGTVQPQGDSNPANALPTPSNAICSGVQSLASGTTGADITPSIDYGLFYSYVILANLTDQAANNLNSFYIFSGWIGFLSSFTSHNVVCSPSPPCVVPTASAISFRTSYDYKPLAGYTAITSMVSSAQFEAVMVFYIMVMQLLFITLFLYIWPYLLAAGVLLQATFFTRKIGGLLIAMSLAAVLIFPILYGMEYGAFSNIGIGPIGGSNLPAIPLYEQPTSGNAIVYGANTMQGGYVLVSGNVISTSCQQSQYVYENVCGYAGTATSSCSSSPLQTQMCVGTASSNINFFVLPRADDVLRYYNCMPDNLVANEAAFAGLYLIPGVGFLSSALGGFVASVPKTPLDFPINGCTPSRAINAALAMTNLYGINFVAGVVLPLINVLVALAAMAGFATLLGGDKDLLGLSNLI